MQGDRFRNAIRLGSYFKRLVLPFDFDTGSIVGRFDGICTG